MELDEAPEVAMLLWLASPVLSSNLPLFHIAGRSNSIGCASASYADGCGFNPNVRQNILSLGFGHENISMTILSLIQEGHLSVTG